MKYQKFSYVAVEARRLLSETNPGKAWNMYMFHWRHLVTKSFNQQAYILANPCFKYEAIKLAPSPGGLRPKFANCVCMPIYGGRWYWAPSLIRVWLTVMYSLCRACPSFKSSTPAAIQVLIIHRTWRRAMMTIGKACWQPNEICVGRGSLCKDSLSVGSIVNIDQGFVMVGRFAQQMSKCSAMLNSNGLRSVFRMQLIWLGSRNLAMNSLEGPCFPPWRWQASHNLKF